MSTETKAVHTPGPWALFDREYGAFRIYAPNEGGVVICDRELWSHRSEESLANARLIAAAPDMLEALKLAKNVMFLLHDEVKALGHKAEQVPEKIRAAILKAEGEL